ncbi:MAG: hypothetical protein K6F53_05065 [Lachnospiraceae bacterium]|nr:hypothetical protein [Lachnospiraceae bacterium]
MSLTITAGNYQYMDQYRGMSRKKEALPGSAFQKGADAGEKAGDLSGRRELASRVRELHKTEQKDRYALRLDSRGRIVGEGVDTEDQERLKLLFQQQNAARNNFSVSSETLMDRLIATRTGQEKEEAPKSDARYNFKEVSNKVRAAKNTISAGQAVLAAKRKVTEMKRKLATAQDDTGEIRLALNHAKQIELVAKKKKRHLEMEELVEHTNERDRESERREDGAQDIRSALTEMADEKVFDEQTDLLEEQTDLLTEAASAFEESGEALTEDMMEELASLTEEFGKEEMEALEEMSEMLSTTEIVDPHMSEEDLKELKTKHRNAENRQMMKADMEYLKEYIKLIEKKRAEALPGMGKNQPFKGTVSMGAPLMSSAAGMPAPEVPAGIPISDGGLSVTPDQTS